MLPMSLETMPPWAARAYREIGVLENPDPKKSHPRILEYARGSHTAGIITDDNVPWCAGFVGWCLEEEGIAGTRSALAVSYSTWGDPLLLDELPPFGALMWVKPIIGAKGTGHVTFFTGRSPDPQHYRGLGGNQSDAVRENDFSIARVGAVRWPRGVIIKPEWRGVIRTDAALRDPPTR